MFKSNILVRLRILWRNRTHAAINVIGLSLGITSSVIIFLVLKFEYSYDSFRPDGDRVYRVVKTFDDGKHPAFQYSALTYPLIPALRNDFADAEFVSLVDAQKSVIRVPKPDGTFAKFREEAIAFVDSSYFDILTQEWIMGNHKALTEPNTVVLSEAVAQKYFGDHDPINRVINYNGEFDLIVSGVVKDPPLNTDFAFTIYVTNNLGSVKRGWDNWGASASNVNCLVKLHISVSETQMENKLKGWHLQYIKSDELENAKNENVVLQPLSDIHFDGEFWNPGGRIVSRASLITMALIGTVLLLTACINFVNLNTVLIIDRSKETGIRKVMGSTRLQLVSQFLGETLLIAVISLFLSLGLVELLAIQLSPILGYRLRFEPFADLMTVSFIMCVLFVVVILAGLYPAVRLAGFQPIRALKSKLGGGSQKGFTLRRSLVVFQLATSQVLIVCTIIAIQQMNFFMSQPIGLNSQAVIEFGIPENGAEKMRLLSDRMLTISGVRNFSASNTGSISDGQWSDNYEATVNNKVVKENAFAKMADENYVDTYGIQLLVGENLVREDSATRCLVNETFVKSLGLSKLQDAIGVPVAIWGHHAIVTGVIRDFNAESLHNKIRPTIILPSSDSYFKGAVRMETENMNETLDQVRATWEAIFPNYVYEQFFLDDVISGMYKAERNVSRLVALFAGMAIFIGSIGLYGLISFIARTRTKEVGIRKSLGASAAQVVGMFSREFILLIAIAFIISMPMAHIFMSEWLNNFEYRIHPGILTFLLGVSFNFVIVLSTIGVRAYRAAVANPVTALRDE
ncbi:MAG TPA: ABC transporter permease [Chryseolinea sp.]|nr:ABC transporter permease [Chryseolinea sp.]